MIEYDVELFLKDFKVKMQFMDIVFLNDRAKNTKTLAILEIPVTKQKQIIEELEIKDYSEGLIEDTNFVGSPLWVFGKIIKGHEIYIKISMGMGCLIVVHCASSFRIPNKLSIKIIHKMKLILSPFSEKILTIQLRKEIIPFQKEEFEVMHHFYEDMGHEFTTTENDEVTLQQVYNQYREKYKLPFHKQIQAIREKYQISASKMSEVLGFGINVYRQYESGEVPNQSNARLIQLTKDPAEFRKLVLLSNAFNEKEQEKILKRIEGLIQEEKNCFSQLIINDYLLCNYIEPSFKNGYVLPNLEKIQNVIIYLVEHITPWKTGLNKLLFYTDFVHYCNHGKSIMGLQYRAIPLGTVPSNYDRILANVMEKELVQVEYVPFSNGNHQPNCNAKPPRKSMD